MKHLHVHQRDLPIALVIENDERAIVMSVEPSGKDRSGKPKLGARLGEAKDEMKRWFASWWRNRRK